MRSRLKSFGVTAIALSLSFCLVSVPYPPEPASAKTAQERKSEADRLNERGIQQCQNDKCEPSLELFKQALKIYREIGNRQGESYALGNLGSVYQALGKYDKAIEYEQLAIAGEIKDRNGKMHGLHNLGVAYRSLDRDREAMTSFQQALTIAREIGDRRMEGYVLADLGIVLSKAPKRELAILYYKQSVNVREAFRKDLRKPYKDTQKFYLDTFSDEDDDYRNLADLLLKQDRVLEAQQVIDLLTVQVLDDYLKTVRGNAQTAKGTDLQRPEQTIIALGNELSALQKLARSGKLDPAKQQRLAYLTSQESDLNQQFNAFLKSPEVQKQIEQLRRSEQAQNVDIEKFNRLRKSLAQVQNAALLYPLILDDRLELILITATTPPIRRTINLKREDLNAAIVEFRANLRDPSSFDVKQDGQKFYDWLIKPFDAELQQAKVQTIVYVPDGKLRYVPLAALYDGKQWLVEKYRIDNITASSLTDFAPRPYSQTRVLAAAATNSQNIKVGDRSVSFSALPASKTEVEAIASRIPQTTLLIDRQFSKTETLPKMQSNSIVHLATHGYFAVGQPEDSFILFGDGSKATLRDIDNWTLINVDLVVLSACETAVGGSLGEGAEILGFGYQIQNAGAGAAIASLWKVSDNGTQALMQSLYEEIKQRNESSSEALRKAQIALIRSKQFSHPFYWSAFILIGNGL